MPKERISKRTVDTLTCPPGKDREFVWDSALAGFGVAAFPSGKKAYYVQYRLDGRSRRAKLGRHGALTPEGARAEAKKFLGKVANGADPLGKRQAAKTISLFRDVASEWRCHVVEKRT